MKSFPYWVWKQRRKCCYPEPKLTVPRIARAPMGAAGPWGPQQSLPYRKPGAPGTIVTCPITASCRTRTKSAIAHTTPATPETIFWSRQPGAHVHVLLLLLPRTLPEQKRKRGLSFLSTSRLLPVPPIDRTGLQPRGKGVWEIEMSRVQPPVIQSKDGQFFTSNSSL